MGTTRDGLMNGNYEQRIPSKLSLVELTEGEDLGGGELVLEFRRDRVKTIQRTLEGIRMRYYGVQGNTGRIYGLNSPPSEYEAIDLLLKKAEELNRELASSPKPN